ncbi:MAG: DUF47 domain-containing protein [Candidatus Jordarchaeum sp.]|uniref:DUF47 domain-containing protein n=1 Tax=Candidatus Jordarchaeum sp. TaxID=2823881 RepID=UPI004049429B
MTIDLNQSKERIVLEIIQDHIRKILSAAKELAPFLEAWLTGNENQMEETLLKISQADNEAEEIKLALLDELSVAATLIQREDMMRLVLITDEIADYAEGAAFRLKGLKDWKPKGTLTEDLRNLVTTMINSVETLREAIFTIIEDAEKAKKAAEEVDKIERFMDQIHRATEQTLFQLNIDHRTLIRLLNIITNLEDTVDIARRAADAVRIIAVARQG